MTFSRIDLYSNLKRTLVIRMWFADDSRSGTFITLLLPGSGIFPQSCTIMFNVPPSKVSIDSWTSHRSFPYPEERFSPVR